MDYETSICFSSDRADQLNKKAFAIDKRLFLFAYYEPKEYIEGESNRSNFITAIINAYGLFWDCCPFMRFLLETRNSILISNWNQTKNAFDSLHNTISAFRSIFCHNDSAVYPLNAIHYDIADVWIQAHGGHNLTFTLLQEADWALLLTEFDKEMNSFISSIERDLDSLINTQSQTRKHSIIMHWIEAIAGNYLRNKDYLLNAMTGMYQFFLVNTHSDTDNTPLRRQTIRWLKRTCGSELIEDKWYEYWLDKDLKHVTQSKIYALIDDWPKQWADYYMCDEADCDEAPLPGGILLRILASDIDNYSCNPQMGYQRKRQT